MGRPGEFSSGQRGSAQAKPALEACHADDRRPPATAVSAATHARPLRSLDEAHAAELRRLFDEAKDRPRYIVALSPT
jgi:hypothetical protein